MQENFNACLQHVLVFEGGWADDPQDPGGATMKGVTLATFRRFFGADKGKDDLRNITDEQLEKVYRTGYWNKCSCDELPSGVDLAVFDAAVNSGPRRAGVWLQAAVGAARDGVVGPDTLSRVATFEPEAVVNDLCDARMAFLRGLPHFPRFGRGWARRVRAVRREGLRMAGASEPAAEASGVSADFVTVKLGSEGEWVAKLQEALEITVDGDFGPKTERALKGFQAAVGLEPDGIAGRLTYRALGLIE